MTTGTSKWIFVSWLIIGCVWLPALAWGQAPSDDAEAAQEEPWNQGVPLERRLEAREIMVDGNGLHDRSRYSEAAARYKEAIAIWPHPAFYFNLAMAQIDLGQPIEAYESLKTAMRYGEAPLGKENYQRARTHLRVQRSKLGRLEVSCQIPGAEVSLDGKRLFTAPGRRQQMVLAGAHQVSASKPGYISANQPITAFAGKSAQIELSLQTLDEASEASRRWTRWKPWTAFAAGAAVTLAGLAIHSRAEVNFDEFDAGYDLLGCGKPDGPIAPGCTDEDLGIELRDQLARARLQQSVAVGSYIAGGMAMATGVVLVYLNRPRLSARESQEQTSPMVVAPLLSPTQAGVSVGFRF